VTLDERCSLLHSTLQLRILGNRTVGGYPAPGGIVIPFSFNSCDVVVNQSLLTLVLGSFAQNGFIRTLRSGGQFLDYYCIPKTLKIN